MRHALAMTSESGTSDVDEKKEGGKRKKKNETCSIRHNRDVFRAKRKRKKTKKEMGKEKGKLQVQNRDIVIF